MAFVTALKTASLASDRNVRARPCGILHPGRNSTAFRPGQLLAGRWLKECWPLLGWRRHERRPRRLRDGRSPHLPRPKNRRDGSILARLPLSGMHLSQGYRQWKETQLLQGADRLTILVVERTCHRRSSRAVLRQRVSRSPHVSTLSSVSMRSWRTSTSTGQATPVSMHGDGVIFIAMDIFWGSLSPMVKRACYGSATGRKPWPRHKGCRPPTVRSDNPSGVMGCASIKLFVLSMPEPTLPADASDGRVCGIIPIV